MRGIIYIMTTAVPGLIKIGKTDNFEKRMYDLEHNGYRNVTALKRCFAIEVEDYSEKERMLHNIFEKSRLADTELFAVDVDLAMQLLVSFDGTIIYPRSESREELFEDSTDKQYGKRIPDGTYFFKKRKKSDNKEVDATVEIVEGQWVLKKGSIIGITEDVGVSQMAKQARACLTMDGTGVLLEDYNLGRCTPSHAGTVVMNQSNNGWMDWKEASGECLNKYRLCDNS